FESADGFLEFFVKGLAHEHDVGDKRAHIDGEQMFVQDTRDYTVQEPGFYGNTPHGIALLVPLLTMLGRASFLMAVDHIGASVNSFGEFLDHEPNVVQA